MSQNKTFGTMAKEVEEALDNLRDEESNRDRQRRDLTNAENHANDARKVLRAKRDAMFEAHPELEARI